MSILIIFTVIMVLLFPIAALVFLVMSIGEYKNAAADWEEKEKLKKNVVIAIVVTVVALVILATVIAVYIFFLLALKNMT